MFSRQPPKVERTEPVLNADRVRDARILLGFSQQDLALAIGVSTRSVQGWESGEDMRRPRGKHIRSLAELAEKPVAWFYETAEVAA